ncbi:hypothetical protein TNCT_387701 [Trichonephila clavata]|uniref:EF-hand domain-containing protein n=1 Tax=Trichonephila clavata TaxID=2740835 RepID=A0A8X6KS17_TRICU|nr:hypothetical protein TNCT_387701 [Trichonephila clavata]
MEYGTIDKSDMNINDFLIHLSIYLSFLLQDELKMAMDLIGESVTEAQLDEMLKATDIDHDGRINYEEFVKILL